jgi:hypothetical protein
MKIFHIKTENLINDKSEKSAAINPSKNNKNPNSTTPKTHQTLNNK